MGIARARLFYDRPDTGRGRCDRRCADEVDLRRVRRLWAIGVLTLSFGHRGLVVNAKKVPPG